MRATVLSLTICATFILLANAEQSRNVNTPEIKDQMQKRAIVVYEVEPQGTNRNTDENLNLPPEDPNAQNSPQTPASGAPNGNAPPAENGATPPVGSSQSGGFGDRKKKDHKEVQTPPVAADQGKQDAKEEETPVKNLKGGDKKAKKEKKEEAVTEKPKKNEGSEEKENNKEDAKEEEANEEEANEEEANEEEQDEEEEEGEEEEEEEEEDEEEEDNDEEEEDVKDQAAQGMAADAQYSQIGNTWFAEEEENTAAEKELTFRPASLSPEKTASGDKPQSSTFKSRQGVEKIIDTPDVSGASKRTAMAVTLSGVAIVGSLFFSL